MQRHALPVHYDLHEERQAKERQRAPRVAGKARHRDPRRRGAARRSGLGHRHHVRGQPGAVALTSVAGSASIVTRKHACTREQTGARARARGDRIVVDVIVRPARAGAPDGERALLCVMYMYSIL